MESMTDWAFSWPISVGTHMISYHSVVGFGASCCATGQTYVGSSPPRFSGGFDRSYAPCVRSSSRVSGRHHSSRLEVEVRSQQYVDGWAQPAAMRRIASCRIMPGIGYDTV